MNDIGPADGMSIDLGDVCAADGVLTVAIVARGRPVDAQAAEWHHVVESSVLRARARGVREQPVFPDPPGNRVLFPLCPQVSIDDQPLPLRRTNSAQIRGIDPPWTAWWRFLLPDHLSGSARMVVRVPGLDRGSGDLVHTGFLRDILSDCPKKHGVDPEGD